MVFGGAAGVAGAELFHHNPSQGQAPTTIGINGNFASFPSAPTRPGPGLNIHAAVYAEQDVTQKVRALVNPEQILTIKKLSDEFADPWPEAKRKGFSVLYQYGDRPMEVWAGR